KLTVGANTVTVTSLGRVCVTGNSQPHTVKFVNVSTGADVAGGSASVNMAGCTPGQFAYTSIAPLILSANTSYYLASLEALGGDQWYDTGTVSATSVATIVNSIYFDGNSWIPGSTTGNSSYVPPNFQYLAGGPSVIQTCTGITGTGANSVTCTFP